MFAFWHEMALFKCLYIASDWTERNVISVGPRTSEEQHKHSLIWEVTYYKDAKENESTRILVFKG